MGISVSGQTGLSMRAIRSMLIVILVLVGTIVYFYGPLIAPTVASAAEQECNDYAGGNFRSYRLEWVSWPNDDPHWRCWDARRPEVQAVSLGWWVNPFS
jgi:hypothetical protein